MRTPRLVILLFMLMLFRLSAFAGTCPSATVYGFVSYGSSSNYANSLSSLGVTTCYFIDMNNGSDSNSGTSESSPWAHSPEMANATATAGAHNVVPGEGYIFKLGTTCSNGCFPITANTSGTNNNPIYYGYDPSWGSGSRPIFNPAGVVSGSNVLVNVGTSTNRLFDNFEVTGFYDNGNNTVFQNNAVFVANGDFNAFTRNYVHGWNTNSSPHDDLVGFFGCNGCSGGNQSHTVWDSNYVNGADAVPPAITNGTASLQAFRYTGGGTFTDNIVRNVSVGNVFGVAAGSLVCGNDFGSIWISFDSSLHENVFEFQTGNNIICNNLYHDTIGPAAWPMPLSPKAGMTDWVFNNVCWNIGRDCVTIDTQGSFPTYTVNLYNNTFVAGGQYCADTSDRGASNVIGTVNAVNNLCITSTGAAATSFCFAGNSTCSTVNNVNQTTNTLLTTAAATTQGFATGGSFVFAPTAASNATVGAGTNASSLATGSLSGLLSDTAYACSVDGNNEVDCPARVPVSRGGSCTPTAGVPGCWDTGAYMYAALAGSKPNPPSGLQASVQ
jgi:hypothetical protein